MAKSSDNSKSQQLDRKTESQLHDLCTKLFDQVISNDELTELNRLLNDDSGARQFYLRYVSLHSLLLGSVDKHQQIESELLGRHIDSNQSGAEDIQSQPGAAFAIDADFPSKPESTGFNTFRLGPLIALAVLSFAAATFWFRNANQEPLTHESFSNSKANTQATEHAPATSVTFVSYDARQANSELPALDESLLTGEIVKLDKGQVELTYRSGTKLLLIGPAEFLVRNTGGKLVRGGLVASVTTAGHGFTIEVPDGKIVDLGTEFGVAVDDFGVSEVDVFHGKVEAFPSKSANDESKIELLKGDGLQWNRGVTTTLDADLRKFATQAASGQFVTDGANAKAALTDQFREGVLDSKNWKTLGTVKPSASGLLLSSDPNVRVNARPFLISTDQFDPLLGPVSVTCDFKFREIAPDGTTAFSILTRGADQRGVALEPWTDLIASCVRCSFGSDGSSGDGVLQAGVKLESNREIVNVSWDGFESPSAGTRYRMVMHDDGTNVSFTVSLVDKPEIQKTVTCRSLFTGKTNFIAIEGAVSGTTVLERVEIKQNLSATKLSNYAEFCSLLREGSSDTAQSELIRQQLADLAPPNAELILHDDFSELAMNDQTWNTLGEVELQDGAVQLGKPNASDHIDTWKARPYLLTRKAFTPKDATLTITGKISFAKNFLDGYGATFAVVTRADEQRGDGPGWENSVLKRGARANFWPASYNMEHSLEIHEKPTANTITLLAKKGAEVNPLSRVYLFRVVDDGNSINLTIVDPRNPDKKMSIASPTSVEIATGFIGFESCWGSPVRLDEVSIFISQLPSDFGDR